MYDLAKIFLFLALLSSALCQAQIQEPDTADLMFSKSSTPQSETRATKTTTLPTKGKHTTEQLTTDYLQAQINFLKQELAIKKTKSTSTDWLKLSTVIVIFIVLIFAMSFVLKALKVNREGSRHLISSNDIILPFGLIFIVTSLIVLVLIAESAEQLTAAIGVLASLGGYIFGSVNKERELTNKNPTTPPS